MKNENTVDMIYEYDQLVKLEKEAYDIKNVANESISNRANYLKAAEKLSDVIQKYNIFIKEYSKYKKLKHDIPMYEIQYIACKGNLEHTYYEKNNCLFMYSYNYSKDLYKAEEYNNESQKHIENAISEMAKLESILSRSNNSMELDQLKKNTIDDKRRWTYYRIQINFYNYLLKASIAAEEKKYGECLDYYRLVVTEAKKLITITEEYKDVLELEYIRISKSIYLAMSSNQAMELFKMFNDKYIREEGIISKSIFIDMLAQLWNAYRFSKEAFIENPMWDGFEKVREGQLRLLEDIISSNKKIWKEIYINFEDNKEFLKIMKSVDSKKYKKVENELLINESKAFKLWKVGSFWLLFIVIIFGGISTVANGMSLWKFLAVATASEIISVIVGGFTLRTLESLSEEGFLKLISIAYKNQLDFLKMFGKLKEDGKKDK